MVNKLNTVSRKCLAHLYSFRLLDGQPYLSLLDTNECNYLLLLVIVYIQWLFNSFGTGSIGRCVALDSTSSGPCMWLTMGCHTCGWGRMVYCVSWCLHAFLICSICLKKCRFLVTFYFVSFVYLSLGFSSC